MPSDSKFDDKVKCKSTVGTLRAASENYKQSGPARSPPTLPSMSILKTAKRD